MAYLALFRLFLKNVNFYNSGLCIVLEQQFADYIYHIQLSSMEVLNTDFRPP